MVSSEKFTEFFKEAEKKKQEKEDAVNKRKLEREEKRKAVQEQKKRKRELQDKKKREKEEARRQQLLEPPKKKTVRHTRKRKFKKTDLDIESDCHSGTSSQCVDNDSDNDILNMNECYGCRGDVDEDVWVQYECKRWFHVGCTKDERLIGKNTKEIEEIDLKCTYFV